MIGLEYATFCSHLMPHLVSSKCLPLLFAKMKHFEAALTQFYNWTNTMGLEFISCSIWILKICFWPRAKGQLNSEWLFGVLNFPKNYEKADKFKCDFIRFFFHPMCVRKSIQWYFQLKMSIIVVFLFLFLVQSARVQSTLAKCLFLFFMLNW